MQVLSFCKVKFVVFYFCHSNGSTKNFGPNLSAHIFVIGHVAEKWQNLLSLYVEVDWYLPIKKVLQLKNFRFIRALSFRIQNFGAIGENFLFLSFISSIRTEKTSRPFCYCWHFTNSCPKRAKPIGIV